MMKNGMAFPPGHPAHPHFKRVPKKDGQVTGTGPQRKLYG